MIVLDVRTPEEFAEGHINNAINAPLHSIEAGLLNSYDRNTKLVVYCRSGARAQTAKILLQSQGFVDVVNCKNMQGCNDYLKD